MLTRIVRLEFQAEKTEEFEHIFEESKNLIRNFKGCLYLSLHKDIHNANAFYTLSKWESEEALNEYRKSELFGRTWKKTKILFSNKPQAFSLEKITEIL